MTKHSLRACKWLSWLLYKQQKPKMHTAIGTPTLLQTEPGKSFLRGHFCPLFFCDNKVHGTPPTRSPFLGTRPPAYLQCTSLHAVLHRSTCHSAGLWSHHGIGPPSTPPSCLCPAALLPRWPRGWELSISATVHCPPQVPSAWWRLCFRAWFSVPLGPTLERASRCGMNIASPPAAT